MTPTHTDPDQGESQRPSRYEWRYGPFRLVMPWAGIIVGAILAIRHPSQTLLWVGVALIALSIVAFFVYRFMAKRGI